MPTYGWVLLAIVTVVVLVCLVWLRRSRRSQPRTREEHRRDAMRAARSIRRSSPRPNRDIFERGRGVPDRHSAAIAENSVLGDAASGGGGGGGD
ncbi:DUF4381 family protein [Polymorphospora rubra]|uniref:DUF4381 family protein n=1 Tax=Polymorphospora rubra TaxID=338584 RepID=UPI001BB3A7C1|nr:DUF4381 family protein [Polymorphospora rubra]